MKKFLKPKILIPAAVGVLLLAGVLYIFLAPSTWWKPFYVRFENDVAAAPVSTEPATLVEPPVDEENLSVAERIQRMDTASAEGGSEPDGIMYPLDTQVVNLAEPGGLRYLQTSIVLELRPHVDLTALNEDDRLLAEENLIIATDKVRPIIDDMIMTYLSSKNFEEIATIDGKEALRQELITSVNERLGYSAVLNIYFTEFVVQ